MHKTDTPTIIASLRKLAWDTGEGIMQEAADRMEEMQTMIDGLSGTIDSQKQTFDALHKKLEAAVTDAESMQWKAAKLEDELSWIQDLATMSGMEGEDSAEVRLGKILQCANDALSPHE
jgi:septation ring formation regulator EzrA